MSEDDHHIVGAVAFTDLVEFTTLTATEGDRAALAVIDAQDRLIADCLPAGARVVKGLGDGAMLWFPTAAGAVRTGVHLQEAFTAAEIGTDAPVWMRVGIHFGRQLRRHGDLFGHDVNVAARVTDQASPREVLVSDATVTACGDDLHGAVAFLPIGPVWMKGLGEPIWLHRAVPVSR